MQELIRVIKKAKFRRQFVFNVKCYIGIMNIKNSTLRIKH
jgi:hypothetical protein